MTGDPMAAEGRILAIDYGTKRVGVAVSDPLRVIAQGLGTLQNDGSLFRELAGIIREGSVSLVVVGMPYGPDGGLGGKAEEVTEFIRKLRDAVPVPIDTWDESYTTIDAQRAFVSGGMRQKKRREKSRVDEMAARLLLQEYLESHDHQ
jgi:putative Holliday junction resolvase